MDARLRILKRLSLSDPESKERYIVELERVVGGLSTPSSMMSLCQDISSLSNYIEDLLIRRGTWHHTAGGVEVNLWIEYDSVEKAEGLCLAENTASVASAIVNHFSMSGFETWSADPLVYLETPYSIFTWEITKKPAPDIRGRLL